MRVNRRLFLGLGGALAVAACTPEPGTTSDPQPGGDVDNGELATRAPGDHFDPFGELLVAAGQVGAVSYQEFVFWAAATGEVTGRVPADLGEVGAVWSWNGDRIAHVAEGGDVVVLESSGTEIARLLVDGPRPRTLSLSPDGLRVAAGTADAGVRVLGIDEETDQHLDLVGAGYQGQVRPHYLPDGRLLVSSAHTQCPPQIWSGDGSALEWSAELEEDYLFLRFADELFTLQTTQAGERTMEVRSYPGFELVDSHVTGLRALSVALDPLGTRLALAVGDPWEARDLVHVLDLASGEKYEFAGHDQPVRSVNFSADASMVYGLAPGTGVIAFDVATGTPGPVFELPD